MNDTRLLQYSPGHLRHHHCRVLEEAMALLPTRLSPERPVVCIVLRKRCELLSKSMIRLRSRNNHKVTNLQRRFSLTGFTKSIAQGIDNHGSHGSTLTFCL